MNQQKVLNLLANSFLASRQVRHALDGIDRFLSYEEPDDDGYYHVSIDTIEWWRYWLRQAKELLGSDDDDG